MTKNLPKMLFNEKEEKSAVLVPGYKNRYAGCAKKYNLNVFNKTGKYKVKKSIEFSFCCKNTFF